MLSWGANSHGQLGQGFLSEECLKPTPVNESPQIIQICGGAGHTLALSSNGELWACGWNNVQQLGMDLPTSTFKKIDCNVKFIQIACGWDFSAGITFENDLYVWGSNVYLNLNAPKVINRPTLVISGVTYVACGLRHMAVLALDGSVLVAGNNVNGQLGVTPISSFTKIPNLSGVKSIACGQKHTLVLTHTNELHAWGDNKWGQLGDLTNPFPKTISQIFCGWTHNVILTEDGELWSWGRNNYGQLGYQSPGFSLVPKKIDLEKVTFFAVGAEHNIAVVGKMVYSWGWNEHGSCGDGNKENILEPKIICSKEVLCVGSGTGQSFIMLK